MLEFLAFVDDCARRQKKRRSSCASVLAMTRDRAARMCTIAVVLALGAFGLARPDAVLAGGAAWLAFLFFVCSGWGWLVMRAARIEDTDFGLRAVWGIAAYIGVTGIPVALGVCSRPVVLAFIAAGAAGFAWRELITAQPLWAVATAGVRAARARPLVAYAAFLIAALALVHILGEVARLERNPWDDDIAYTPLTKRLLDAGNLVEPFSFRRLAAYGGQFAAEALAGARGTTANIHLVDQGMCFGLFVLVVLGHARQLTRVPALWLAVIVLTLVTLPNIAINTASYWSGAMMFLALYRTIERGDFTRMAVVGAALCTLRQSYLPVVLAFVALALWRVRAERRVWRRVAMVFAAVLLPWCAAALVSSHTFLFPLVQGTWNHGLPLQPAPWSWVDELSLLFTSIIDAQPLVVMVLVVPLVAFATDDRPTRPLAALLVAGVVGFTLSVHGFSAADPSTLWRYAFAYALPLFIALALEVGAERVQLPELGRWLVLVTVLLQLAAARTHVVKDYAFAFADLREAAAIDSHGDPNARAEVRRYAALQAAVPTNARLAVMLDDPAFLDFRRNPIANLDTPGFASPGTQMPSFSGAEAMRAYLLDEGYRYLAFVRPDKSRYFFRREFWIWRLWHDSEFFQAQSAYAIDTIDTFVQLAGTSHVLYDQDGLVALDLDAPHAPAPQLAAADEPARRDAFLRALAGREHMEREWSLASRKDLAFEDGVSGQTYAQRADDAHWYDVFVRDPEPKHGQPIRWMRRRVHLRVRGDGRMHLVMRGHMNLGLMYTRPRLDVSLGGELLGSFQVDEAGAFAIDLDVTAPHAWDDLYVVFNTIGEFERDLHDLRLARLEEVQWEPR
jgi:hypothetical protein